MKIITLVISLSALMFIVGSFTAQARMTGGEFSATEKSFSLGLGGYALNTSVEGYEIEGYEDVKLRGAALSVTYAINNNLMLGGQYYSLGHDQISSLKVLGFEATAYAGIGLVETGFKAYLGAGYFSETWTLDVGDSDFSGAHVKAGVGYSFEFVTLDLAVGMRDSGSYEENLTTENSSAMSAIASVSARF